MKVNQSKKIANWGLYPSIKATEYIPNTKEDFKKAIHSSSKIITRGNGRCYGDAALQNDIISTKKWNKFIEFDRKRGFIEVEAGVLLSDIIEVAVPSGYFITVTPGTKFITVGGAIASDVHGKNHHVDGCFSEHVVYFDLMLASGEVVRCSRDVNSDLFWATIGGMGLTGVILSARFLLTKIETAYIRNEAIQANNLDEIFKLFEESESWTYTVAWLDCLQKGENLGKSIMLRGEHATLAELPKKIKKNPLKIKPKLKLNIPFFFPNFLLNPWSIKIFNWLYFNKQLKKHVKNYVDYDQFFYPLDAVYNWNKIYGKNGFIQYQFVIPKENGLEGMRQILTEIASSGNGSFLVVLKLFGANNPKAYNSFPKPGYTLALDFKVNKGLKELIAKLDQIVEKHNGRIYRTKDAMSNPKLTNYLKNIDSTKFQSMQNERINRHN